MIARDTLAYLAARCRCHSVESVAWSVFDGPKFGENPEQFPCDLADFSRRPNLFLRCELLAGPVQSNKLYTPTAPSPKRVCTNFRNWFVACSSVRAVRVGAQTRQL